MSCGAVKNVDEGGVCEDLPENAHENSEGEDCPISASMIGLTSGLVFCLLIMTAIVIYLHQKKRETQVKIRKW